MDPFWMMQQQQQQWLGLLPPPLLFTSTGSTVPSQLLLSSQDSRSPSAAFSEEFVMYNWKTSNCIKRFCHDWSVCPFVHPNEKCRRRSPKTYQYDAVVCPDAKNFNTCPRGDACHMSHSVYEYWLHPQKFHTELCRNGSRCNRKVCFFAHTTEGLRNPKTHRLRPEPRPNGQVAASEAIQPMQDTSTVVLAVPAAAPPQDGNPSALCAAAAPVLQPGTAGLSAMQSDSSASTPTGQAQDTVSLLPAFRPQHSSAPRLFGTGQQPQGLNRQQRRQHLQHGAHKGAGGGSGLVLAAPQAAHMHGVLASLAAAPSHFNAVPMPGSIIAQLQAQLAALNVASATAAAASAMYSSQQAAYGPAAVHSGFGGSAGGVLFNQAMQQQAVLPQYAQQCYSFNGPHLVPSSSQPLIMGGGSQGTVGGQLFAQQQAAPVTLSAGDMAGAGYGMVSAAQVDSQGVFYQRVPATAGMQQGVAKVSSSSSSMESGAVQQQVMVPEQLVHHVGGQGVSAPPGSTTSMLQPGSFDIQ